RSDTHQSQPVMVMCFARGSTHLQLSVGVDGYRCAPPILRSNEKAPDQIRGFVFGARFRVAYSGLPIATFSVPTPSTPHSIWSPGLSAETPAGVPVMMMSPAASATCCESCQMISGTFQISSVRSPFCVSLPLTVSQILPFEGWPILEAGCRAEQGAE